MESSIVFLTQNLGDNQKFEESYLDNFISFFIKNYKVKENIKVLNSDGLNLDSFGENTFFIMEEEVFLASSDFEKEVFLDKSIILCENLSLLDVSVYNCVNKYQNVRKICEYILNFVMEKTQGELVKGLSKRAKIYVFYSPVTLSGTSVLAESFTYIKSSMGKKVLHLSLDAFHKIRFAGESIYSSSNYFSDEGKKMNLLNLEKMLTKYNNISYLKAFDYALDMSCLDEGDFAGFIDYVSNCGGYDYICIDLGSGYFSYLNALIDILDFWIMPLGDFAFKRKYSVFNDEILRMFEGRYDDKIIRVSNTLRGEGNELKCDFKLPYDSYLRDREILDDDFLNTRFANTLRRVVGER